MKALGRRILAMTAGLEPRSAAAARELGLRLLKGETVPDAEIVAVFPAMRRMLGQTVGGGSGAVACEDGCDAGTDDRGASLTRLCQWLGLLDLSGPLAIVRIGGPIYFGAGIFDLLVFGVVPTELVVAAFDGAAASGKQRVLMDLHCPGGSVFGWSDMEAAVGRCRAAGMEIYAAAHEVAASMGYRLACLADEGGVVVTPDSVVGAIGTLIPMYDDSEMFKKNGVRPHMIASHPDKAAGWPGVPLTDENTADLSRTVEHDFRRFTALVSERRGIPVATIEAMKAATFPSTDAVAARLADRVVGGGFDAYVDELSADASAPPVVVRVGGAGAPGEGTMAKDLKTMTAAEFRAERPDLAEAIEREGASRAAPKPATVAELKAEFPGDERAGFVLACLEKGRTMPEAKAAFADVLGKERNAATARAATAEARAAALDQQVKGLGVEGKGVTPVSGGPGGGGGDQPAKYEDAVNQVMRDEKKTKAEAIAIVNKRFPALRAEIAGHNGAFGRR